MDIKTANGWVSLNPVNYDAQTEAFWQAQRTSDADRFEVNATYGLRLKDNTTANHHFVKVRELTPAEEARSAEIRTGRPVGYLRAA